jgi:hypothetical protein
MILTDLLLFKKSNTIVFQFRAGARTGSGQRDVPDPFLLKGLCPTGAGSPTYDKYMYNANYEINNHFYTNIKCRYSYDSNNSVIEYKKDNYANMRMQRDEWSVTEIRSKDKQSMYECTQPPLGAWPILPPGKSSAANSWQTFPPDPPKKCVTTLAKNVGPYTWKINSQRWTFLIFLRFTLHNGREKFSISMESYFFCETLFLWKFKVKKRSAL